ncbi:IPT/TIG domain-containing protein [Mucilaginibacter ginsenosidivorax]|uniref:IPT/TIG domain-containing protein n=1 Tax=Mucilaginibacter ginsenosidivorax TaxID=862126 RepID=UPI00131572B4|nr:IPT/TIG domain-containing protein [Mucilaginibacter ginsenosidivorax]
MIQLISKITGKFILLSLATGIILSSCQKQSEQPPIVASPTAVPGAPTITGISPATGDGGTIVTVTGTNFDTVIAGDTVMVNGVPGVVKSATATSLTFAVPQNGMSGPVRVASSKGFAIGPDFHFPHTIYATGYQRTKANSNSLIMIWKNSNGHYVDGYQAFGEGLGIAVMDTDVYVAGWNYNSGAIETARYWKNNAETVLYEGLNWSTGNAIAVNGSDVYVAGFRAVDVYNSQYVACYWKNGACTYLSQPGPWGVANSIAISGSNVYMAGCYTGLQPSDYVAFNWPCYWKNGKMETITPMHPDGYSTANSIFISGSDIYVAWSELYGVSTAYIWKNGVSIALTDGAHDADVKSVFVVGNDVYAAGYESNGSRKVAKYWKNGVPVSLTNGSTDAEANSISVVGNDVYVGGYVSVSGYALIDNSDSGCIATIWKNGTPYYLNNPIYPAKVYAITVK